ncbi:MAG: NAD(P)/FAD-dependent oxidoreductase [Oscillospiraceae bacterium]|jgi:2,4-dienoyl-CoA reductase-like NADH-dependent reductase (Old Yellow Enzyme family)/thioredoxin reductase|nr:NAD(P)/FAD-dependent oxidoreductase [Oscillospiraceae bacterium]
MSISKYPHLFEPFAIGNTVFRNRIFASPEGYYNVGADNLPGLDEIAFFERKALGGFASVSVGDCIVDSATGVHYPYLIRMDDPNTLPGLSALASAITRNGAAASAELSHAGMYARFIKDPGGKNYGPDTTGEFEARKDGAKGGTLYGPVYMADGKYGEVEAMPEELILHIVEKYGQAAAWAKRCGFNMVTVHAGHGWMLAQFMSPIVNTRADRWGGSLENRMRFPLAVVDSIRKHVGRDFPIEIRISGSECSEYAYDLAEGVKIAEALDGKVDILHISAGHHEFEETFLITHPSMFMEDGVNVKFAAEIKKHVKTPVATVGALTDPQMMEEIIASGKADIVQLGRQSLADPDMPLKARLGREDDIDKCLRCCMCFSGAGTHRYLQCSINPSIGRELEEQGAIPPREKKRVLVAGGGVGGMQAAISCSKQGHEVILCEKSGRLGGVLRCEQNVPFKARLEEYLDRQARRISRMPITVRLNTEVTQEYVESINPDVIIAALGARPAVPPIPGIDGTTVIGAEELYNDPSIAGDALVIIGGGLVGIELGVFMAGRGKKVTIVEIMEDFALDTFGMHSMALMSEIARLGVGTYLSTTVKGISREGVSCENADGTFMLPADMVVYATGQKPLREEAFALSRCAPEFYQIGDCTTPRNIMTATREAYTVARNIGRI